jgi:hypothetical protein
MSLNEEDKQWFQGELAQVLAEIERVETSLLTEFHKDGSSRHSRPAQ